MTNILCNPFSNPFYARRTGFLILGQKCHFRPISENSNRSFLDTLGLQVTRFSARSIQVGYTSRAEQLFRGRFWSVEDNPPVNALSCCAGITPNPVSLLPIWSLMRGMPPQIG